MWLNPHVVGCKLTLLEASVLVQVGFKKMLPGLCLLVCSVFPQCTSYSAQCEGTFHVKHWYKHVGIRTDFLEFRPAGVKQSKAGLSSALPAAQGCSHNPVSPLKPPAYAKPRPALKIRGWEGEFVFCSVAGGCSHQCCEWEMSCTPFRWAVGFGCAAGSP